MTTFSERQGFMYVSDSQGQDIMITNFGCFQSAGVQAKDQGVVAISRSGYRMDAGPKSRKT